MLIARRSFAAQAKAKAKAAAKRRRGLLTPTPLFQDKK